MRDEFNAGGKEMKKKNLSFLSVLVVVTMIVAIFAPIGLVVASGGQQHNIYGIATSGASPPGSNAAGAEITAWIDGVNYGSNTTLGTAEFDLYVDGDVWGVAGDDIVKDGGWEGDEIMYFLDYAPTDYHLTIANHVSIFNSSAYENFTSPTLYFDTNTYADAAYPIAGGTYLRGLKINEICLIPGDGFPQYLYLYDPGGELDEAMLEHGTHGYYIQKDDTVNNDPIGDEFHFSANQAYVERLGGTNYYYINLTGFSLDPNGDELKLVWKNPGDTSDNIADGYDVIVDRVEWGNHANNISTTTPPDDREYDNTTLLDCPGSLIAGQSFRRFPNGTDTDNCQSDFDPLPMTGRPAAIKILDYPGAPTDLRVHRGPWNTIGNADDLVLSWISPTWKWANLTKNIVYYDTDISDGFQYTNYHMFSPNSTFGGDADWCRLPGYHLDGNDYCFIVHTTGDTVGSYENMTDSNVGYKQNIVLDSTMGILWVSIPYFSDYDFASDITNDGFPDGSIISAVRKWDYLTQTYLTRSYFMGWIGDFDIIPGDAIYVFVTTSVSFTWKIVGAHDPALNFALLENVGTTDFMMLSLPYHRTYQKASDISSDFTQNQQIDIVGQYNYTTGYWDTWYWSFIKFAWDGFDFTIFDSPADAILFEVKKTAPAYTWQPTVAF